MTNIKDTLIKVKNREIHDIEEKISDLKREIFDNQADITCTDCKQNYSLGEC